jgi:MFS transporter, DHA2 family, multidrug resistance protein
VSGGTLDRVRDNLTGALATGDDTVTSVARDAFTAGFHVVAGASALLVLGLALLVAITLRSLPSAQDGPSDPGVPDD